jgi:hypothetical protein
MMYFKKLSMVSSILFFTAGAVLWAQTIEDLLPSLQDRALVLDITVRVLEKDSQEIWNSSSSKVTIPGRAVGVKLVGSNVVVAINFTPYLTQEGNTILVAQGQIWVNVSEQGIQYKTTIQTIPITFGEQVYFLPLGSSPSDEDAYIELLLNLHPYKAPESKIPDETLPPPIENEKK